MEIVVNDTEVLIDMYNADLLGLVERCSITFHTVDYVMAERLEQLLRINPRLPKDLFWERIKALREL